MEGIIPYSTVYHLQLILLADILHKNYIHLIAINVANKKYSFITGIRQWTLISYAKNI